MYNIKHIDSFLQESEAINEAVSPFYDGANAIQAIISSDEVARKLKQQPIQMINRSKDGLSYNVTNINEIKVTVELERVPGAKNQYGGATYKVKGVYQNYGSPFN